MSNTVVKKGQLHIFTSYTPGAGKSYAMLQEAIKQKHNGKKLIIGLIYGKHRDISKLLIDNGIVGYKGGRYSLKKIIRMKPDLVVLDEMGVRGANADEKRFVYEDIDQLLDCGIDVYTSVNLKRFEKINPLFKEVTGLTVRTKIPDRFLENAERVYFIDRSPQAMQNDAKGENLFDENTMKSKVMQKNFNIDTLKAYRDLSIDYLKKNYNSKLEIIKR